MPRTPAIQFRAIGPTGDALTARTERLDPDNPGPDLAETARTVITAWDRLMAAELAGLHLDAATVEQILDVLSGTVIDDVAQADPRGFFLGEIEDCLDDLTGKPAYPELLDAAGQWSPAQSAAVLDAVVRLRARRHAHRDESGARSLRAVGLAAPLTAGRPTGEL